MPGDDLELMSLQPPPTECWGPRCAQPYPVLCICLTLTMEQHPQPEPLMFGFPKTVLRYKAWRDSLKCHPVMDWGPAVSEAPSFPALWCNGQQNPNERKTGHPESKRVAINWCMFGWLRDSPVAALCPCPFFYAPARPWWLESGCPQAPHLSALMLGLSLFFVSSKLIC